MTTWPGIRDAPAPHLAEEIQECFKCALDQRVVIFLNKHHLVEPAPLNTDEVCRGPRHSDETATQACS